MLYDNNNGNNPNNGWGGMPQMGYWGNNRLPQYDIVRVNGENGANAFQMGPNSKILLLDEHEPIVWLVQTDGAGYKTVKPYNVTPREVAPPVNINSLEERIAALEEKINVKSNSRGANKAAKRQAADETIPTATVE